MLQIDDKFLEELGLGALPQEEKDKLKAHIYETLEMRVGTKLASGMSDAQLTEFEGFTTGDVSLAEGYLDRIFPNWRQDPAYLKSLESEKSYTQSRNLPSNPDAVTAEYAALKWLETNFPDYKKVVSEELEGLKNEIKQVAPQIVSEINNSNQSS